jgi:hypothetical protein
MYASDPAVRPHGLFRFVAARARMLCCAVTLITFPLAMGCTEVPDSQALEAREKGMLSRMFGNLAEFFGLKAAEDVPIAPVEPWTPPVGQGDPAVDELFEVMGLEEVQPEADQNLDGALVGLYEHFPDDNDPDDFYDSVCFFARSPDMMPSQESLFWAEMYGLRAANGKVSDIDGNEIGQECVGCEEGNVDGGETRVIFFVNGIKTDWERHCSYLEAVANKTGGVVIGIYNATEGTVKDIWETAWDKFTLSVETSLTKFGIDKTIEVNQNSAAVVLTNVVMQRIRQGKHVEIWAHSQGGAVTALALHRALRELSKEGLYPVTRNGEEYPQAIRVVTFGSAASQWPEGLWPNGPIYEHYVHVRDATPSAIGVGAWGGFSKHHQTRAGGDAKMVFFDGEPTELDELNDDPFVDQQPPLFEEIPAEDANVSFFDLKLQKYHNALTVYFEMYEQRHGAWNF